MRCNDIRVFDAVVNRASSELIGDLDKLEMFLTEVSSQGNVHMVNTLFGLLDLYYDNNPHDEEFSSELWEAVNCAAENGHYDIVLLFANNTYGEGFWYSAAIVGASFGGHTDIVSRLINDYSQDTHDRCFREALCEAAKYNHRDIVDIILEHIGYECSILIVTNAAAKYGYIDLLDDMLKISHMDEDFCIDDILQTAILSRSSNSRITVGKILKFIEFSIERTSNPEYLIECLKQQLDQNLYGDEELSSVLLEQIRKVEPAYTHLYT